MEKLLEDTTRRLDTLEKSKQKEEEEEILSNTTQDLQEIPNKPVVRDKNDANEETEDSSSDSSSDDDDNEELEASRAECTKLREEVKYEKGKNAVACKMLEKWEVEKKELQQAMQAKEREYYRAVEETDKNMRTITNLRKEMKGLKTAASQSARLTEERVEVYEKRVTELNKKVDEKNGRLRVLELNNTRMVLINCDLEKRVKTLTVAERKMQDEHKRKHLMKKQIFETPRADVPYFSEFEAKDKRIGYRCKKDCIVGGQKWVDFKKDYNITIKSHELYLAFMNKHVLEHWTEFQAMKEIQKSNRNQKGRKSWLEIVETYNSAGKLGNHGFDITEICILNTSQVQKTAMGIAENMWIIDAVCNMFDKMMLAAIQICSLKDYETKKNVTEQDGEEIMKIWDEARRLLMKGKEIIPRSAERMPIPNPIYLFEIFTFTCEYKEEKIIRDIGGRFYNNRVKLSCEELKRTMDDLKGEL